jgi:hypothetical protein
MKNKCLYIFLLLFLLPATINLNSCSFSKPVSKPSSTAPATAPATTVTPAVPVIQAWIAPTAIAPGDSARLSWDVSNATSVAIDQGIGVVPLSGWRQVSPDATTTYNITAHFADGTVKNSVTLAVSAAEALPSGSTVDNNWVGSTYTMEYHYPWCSIAKRITPPHKVWFEAWQDALDSGYHPCPVCKPPHRNEL